MTFFCSKGIKERRSKADFAPTCTDAIIILSHEMGGSKTKSKPSAAGSIWKGGATE